MEDQNIALDEQSNPTEQQQQEQSQPTLPADDRSQFRAPDQFQQNPSSASSENQEQLQYSQQQQSTFQRIRTISRIDSENPFLQNLAKQQNILIEVTGYKLYDSNISKYAMYTVLGKDKNGDFEVQRRYSEFDQIRKLMIKRWPGCYIPPLPSKKAIGNTESNFLTERKKYLHTFCNSVAKLGYLFYSVEFQLFLRHKDADISKKLTLLEDCTVVDIIEKYKGQFYKLAGVTIFFSKVNINQYILFDSQQEVNGEMIQTIASFQSFLKRSKEVLKEQRLTIQELTISRKNTDMQLRKFQKFTIQRYEKDILSEYTLGKKSDMIFINEEENSELQRLIEDMGEVIELEPFSLLYDLINHELKDTQAFLDALERKDFYENRKRQLENILTDKQSQLSALTNGKKTLRSIFTKGDTETQKDNLKKEITDLEEDIQFNAQLNEIIIGIVGMIEIDKYKKTKARQYYEVMTTVSKLELECIEKQTNLWKIINETASQKLKNFNERNSAEVQEKQQ